MWIFANKFSASLWKWLYHLQTWKHVADHKKIVLGCTIYLLTLQGIILLYHLNTHLSIFQYFQLAISFEWLSICEINMQDIIELNVINSRRLWKIAFVDNGWLLYIYIYYLFRKTWMSTWYTHAVQVAILQKMIMINYKIDIHISIENTY